MAINFPDNPTIGQTFTSANRTWTYNGSAWVGDYSSTGNADTIDGIDSSQFLRSDTNDTATGRITFQNSADSQIILNGNGTSWAGISFQDVSGGDTMWFNGSTGTFTLGGGGSVVAGKKLHVDGGLSVGATADSIATPSNGIYSQGAIQLSGYINDNDCFEKLLYTPYFTNGVSNLAIDITFGNLSFWGYIEIEVTSSYSYQNSAGKLTKVYAVGTNPNNLIYTNESRVVDAIGTIVQNVSLGEFAWDASNSRYIIPVSHITSTGNGFTIKVKMFTHGVGSRTVFDTVGLSGLYTLSALPRNYVYFNDNVGIGNTSPRAKLTIDAGNITGTQELLNLHNQSQGTGHGTSLTFSGWTTTTAYPTWRFSGIKGLYDTTSAGLNAGGFGGRLNFFVNRGGSATQFEDVMTITGGSRVGIGTTNPTSKLQVNGTVTATSFSGDGSALTGIAAGVGLFKGDNGERGDTTNGAGDIFRINKQTLASNVTIDADENASCAGPLTIGTGVTLVVNGNLTVV